MQQWQEEKERHELVRITENQGDNEIMTEINEIANTICRDLPEGYEIVLSLENGYGGVMLICPGGTRRGGDPEIPMNERLIHALRMAEELTHDQKES